IFRFVQMSTQRSSKKVWVEEDELNDETFGDSVENITNEFDFFVLTLDEIEQKMIRETKEKNLKALERKFIFDHESFMQEKISNSENQSSLMTRNDIHHLLKIQISQLVAEEPMSENFYSHMHNILHNQTKSASDVPDTDNADTSGKTAELGRVNHKVQKLINDARNRAPKQNKFVLEGTLGKPIHGSSRTPKQAIQVGKLDSNSETKDSQQGDSRTDNTAQNFPAHQYFQTISSPQNEKRYVLQKIEKIYDTVLFMEHILRKYQILNPQYYASGPWLAKYNEAKNEMWLLLEVENPVSSEFPHPFVKILSLNKGVRIIPRVVHHLLPDQVLAMLTTLVANYESLDACKLDHTGLDISSSKQESVSLFMTCVIPSIMACISEVPLKIINGLLALFIDRNSITWVIRSKPGMVLLTLLLTRAEELKAQALSLNPNLAQSGAIDPSTIAHNNAADQHTLLRYSELYSMIISALKPQLPSLVPQLSSTLVLNQFTLNMANEDSYIWQFLASLAVAANFEQQHTLVSLLRESIFDRLQITNSPAINQETKAIVTANLNMFLNAIGLDVSQISM
ncbi:hypothetical protein BB560_002720, partial [Smittium megazygosporum]